MKIGLRNIKTALAILICLVIIRLFNGENYFYACIAAVISMQTSVYASYKAGLNRMIGTSIGALTGITLAYLSAGNFILIVFGIILVIYLCNIFNYKQAVSIACIVFIAIMTNLKGVSPMIYGSKRLIETFLGIAIAVSVNYLVFPHESNKHIKKYYKDLKDDIKEIFISVLKNEENNKLHTFRNDITFFENLFTSYDKEHHYNKKNKEQIEYMVDRIELFKEGNIHIKVVNNMRGNCFIDVFNCKRLKELSYECSFYENNVCKIGNDNSEDIVFNYHIKRLIEIIEILDGEDTKKAA